MDGITMADSVPIITAIINIGFSAIVGWYLLTKGIPNTQQKFSEDMKNQRTDFTEAMKEQRSDFSSALIQQRNDYGAAVEREKNANLKLLDLLSNQILEICKKSHEKIDQILRITEENRREK